MIYVLIGGKSKDSSFNKIEEYALSLTTKAKPNLLFIPLATSDTKKTTNKFITLMDKLSYELKVLDFDNYSEFDSLMDWADIIYVSGGVCDNLVNFFKEKKLDAILKKYLDTNKIFVGSSAGAMLLTVSSMGDRDMFSDNFHNYNYKMVTCLGHLNISICPHYQNEDLIIYNDEVAKLSIPAFGIEEDTALILDGNRYSVIKDYKQRSVYYFDYKNNHKMIPLYEGDIYENSSDFRS